MSLRAGAIFRSSWVPSFTKRDDCIEISIDNHFQSKVYTSGSVISGCVTISPQRPLAFESVDIAFVGTATTQIAMIHRDAPSGHTFLQLNMALDDNALPDARIFGPGEPYNLPFTFLIPHRLPSASCKYHPDTVVHERHTYLPPTVSSGEHPDAPYIAQVEYSVTARIITRPQKNGKPKPLEKVHPIRILPLIPEQQLHITPNNATYHLTQEREVSRDLLSHQIGHLIATATRIDPIIISVDTLKTSDSSVTVNLQFDPTSSEAIPPNIRAKSAHVEIVTHYSLGHVGYLPDQESRPAGTVMNSPVLRYFDSSEWVIKDPGETKWDHVSAQDQTSGGSNAVKKGSARYQAILAVQLEPPTERKLLVPTFHSCRMSRTYTLRLGLDASDFRAALTLVVPLQVIAQSSGPSMSGLPDYVSKIESAYADPEAKTLQG
ncbi:hypothetical protein FALBO_6768 [Fusarium albosuccineum]|uniref:Arrestin-like N-terminal domain-containing protein n=1 Tax=Fusarium albosuccineum TaxID=1237068 RepID=A0A8H4LDY4_9HYPO|nr:hypothetical protein FALBO_6768 [Fusarium albosuccineum]